MEDEIILNVFLEDLKKEVSDSKEMRTAVETLITIYRKILQDAHNEKYRKINTLNRTFIEKVWRFLSIRQFMWKTGWRMRGTDIYFEECMCLRQIIHVLLDKRLTVPSEDEWVEGTKYEGKSKEQLREEELKQKAIAERDKELQECLKEKKFREELAKTVKAEHEADRNRRRFQSAQTANVLTKGARVKTLYST